MAIQFVSVKCPECNAVLSIEKDRNMAFCSYCGAKIMLNNENEHVYREIDEARIREAELEQMVRLKELEIEEKDRDRTRKGVAIGFGVALIFVIVGALMCAISKEMTGMGGVVIGLWIGLFTLMKSDDLKKRRDKDD